MVKAPRNLYGGKVIEVKASSTRSVVGHAVLWVRLAGLRPASSSPRSANAVRKRYSVRVSTNLCQLSVFRLGVCESLSTVWC
jgi:hypothetical protein